MTFKSLHPHQEAYKKVYLSKLDITSLISLTKDNLWFNYLLKCFNKDVGWIDFEKEISVVIKQFNIFFASNQEYFAFLKDEPLLYYILQQFNFFYEEYNSGIIGGATNRIKKEYTIEYPFGSGNTVVNKEKIVKTLMNELSTLADALKLYLKIFVENTLSDIIKEKDFQKCPALKFNEQIISFNYTNTYEILYRSNKIFHIHGHVEDKIILGINPDETDILETVDTLFIGFKKYFQRTMYETDVDFIKWIENISEDNHEISLLVMGHSLDITDEDIITELFYNANEITILYHNNEAKASYIANLVNIFGKDEFDEIRKNKHLIFLPLDMDFTEFITDRESKSYDEFIEGFFGEENSIII